MVCVVRLRGHRQARTDLTSTFDYEIAAGTQNSERADVHAVADSHSTAARVQTASALKPAIFPNGNIIAQADTADGGTFEIAAVPKGNAPPKPQPFGRNEFDAPAKQQSARTPQAQQRPQESAHETARPFFEQIFQIGKTDILVCPAAEEI
jgi:hypothetical protein